MIQWLFFYRIDTKSTGSSPGGQDELIVDSLANETKASLTVAQAAISGA